MRKVHCERLKVMSTLCTILTHLMARPHPYLSLCGRQPLRFWVIAKDVEERVGQRAEVPRCVDVLVVDYVALASGSRQYFQNFSR